MKLNSLDLVMFAYLKQELINTPESGEVTYVKESCPLLTSYVEYMDKMLGMVTEMKKED